MNTITTEAPISNDHKLNLNLDLPENYPVGKAIVAITIAPQGGRVLLIQNMKSGNWARYKKP